MIPFKIPKEIGMPYHGLAVDGILAHPTGDKDIEMPSYYGPCQVIRHPSALGAVRNTNEIAHDTANSLEWRDYALMTGVSHGLNGSQGLGAGNWLYCDPGGNTWIVGIEESNNANTKTVELWLKEVFGRFGRQYEITPRLLATLDFEPTIPSWYVGSATPASIVPDTTFTTASSIVFSPSGDDAYINGYCTRTATSQDVYEETLPLDLNGTPTGSSMLGVLRAQISGTGDINDNGVGITATLVVNMEYEANIVIARDSYAFGEFTPDPTPTCSVSGTGVPQPPTDGCAGGEETLNFVLDYSLNVVGPTTGTSAKLGTDFTAVLYKSHQGVVTQKIKSYSETTWEFNTGGQHRIEYDLSNCDKGNGTWPGYTSGPQWFVVSCSSSSGDDLWSENKSTNIDFKEVLFDVYGLQYQQTYQRDRMTRDRNGAGLEGCGGGTGLPCCINDGACPDDPDQFEETDTAILNGAPITPTNSVNFYRDLRVIGPNLIYAMLARPNTDFLDMQMIEDVVVYNENAQVSNAFNQSTDYAFLPGPRYVPDTRELVLSYQPVTEEFSHAQTTLFIAHSGVLYQYV